MSISYSYFIFIQCLLLIEFVNLKTICINLLPKMALHSFFTLSPLKVSNSGKSMMIPRMNSINKSRLMRQSTKANLITPEPESSNKEVIELRRENAFPTHFVGSRGIGRPIYALIPGKKGELLTDYVLFEESMKKVNRVPWTCYDQMNCEERTIYTKHLKAVEARKLFYKCPITGDIVKTVSQLLYDGKCCGGGCRHCPYELIECSVTVKKSLVWNGAYYT